MNILDRYHAMDYGPAPESDKDVRAWIKTHAKGLGLYINGERYIAR